MGFRLTALAVLLFSLTASSFALGGDSAPDRPDPRPPATLHTPQPTYKVEAGLDGEIYPVFANYASLQAQNQRTFGMIAVTISNHSDGLLHQRVEVKVPGWSDAEIQVAELGAGAVRTLLFAPTFLPRFYKNHEIVAATAQVSVSDLNGRSVYETTIPVHLRSSEDIYWGHSFKYAPFIASWVTPHDPEVEALLARAKEYVVDHRLPGYETWKSQAQQELETYREAKAIFTALKESGLSYVKSSLTLGGHQAYSERVRMPRVSLHLSSANCIDAAVLYASLFENLGMDSTVTIVPGHAYVGVRTGSGSAKFLFIDAALTGRSTFEAAVSSAEAGLSEHDPGSVTKVIIEDARAAGIYPMP